MTFQSPLLTSSVTERIFRLRCIPPRCSSASAVNILSRTRISAVCIVLSSFVKSPEVVSTAIAGNENISKRVTILRVFISSTP
jgi:hypothetical protein